MSSWRVDFVIKSTDYSSLKPGFDSQDSGGGLKPSVTLVPENLTPSSGLLIQAQTRYTGIQAGQTSICKKNNNTSFLKVTFK